MSNSGSSFLQPGAQFHGRYRVVRRIKAGGMGAVYEVVDERTDTSRALKIMLPGVVEDPEMRARFAMEARVAGKIESDHIVGTMDAGIDEETETPFLVMELLRGQDLAAALASDGPFGRDEVVTFLYQAALALEKTHAADIVHRDLKPENLFLTHRDDGSPRIKILDFGIAKVVAQSTHGAGTKPIGTPLYMAPEQTHLRGRVTPRVDLYALGHIAYALLTGAAYWSEELNASESLVAFLGEVARGVQERPSARAARRGIELPARFDGWFLKATAASPSERFDGALAQIEALAEALSVRFSGRSTSPGAAPAERSGERYMDRSAARTLERPVVPSDDATARVNTAVPSMALAPTEPTPQEALKPQSTTGALAVGSASNPKPSRNALLGAGALVVVGGVALLALRVYSPAAGGENQKVAVPWKIGLEMSPPASPELTPAASGEASAGAPRIASSPPEAPAASPPTASPTPSTKTTTKPSARPTASAVPQEAPREPPPAPAQTAPPAAPGREPFF